MTIFYFSGTGNSLDTARKISEEFPGCRVLAMKKGLVSESVIDDSVIGFVFPVFAYGPPRIVRDFILNHRFSKTQYLFAIATCGGTPGSTVQLLNRFIKKSGGILSAGFIIKAPSHPMNTNGMTGIIKFMYNISGKKNFGFYEDRKEEIIGIVGRKERNRFDQSSALANFFGARISGMAMKMLSQTAKQFQCDDTCTSCGTCAKLCPRQNITLEDNRPKWGTDCEACNACIQWCPSKAINMGEQTVPGMRSHNRNVKISEMVG